MMCKSWDKEKEILVYSEGKLLISKLYALTIKNKNIYIRLIKKVVQKDLIVNIVMDGKN